MEKNWSINAWERFLREALTEINERVLVDLLDAVDKDRSWKSWLEALPGKELKKEEVVREQWDSFVEKHKEIVNQVLSRPYVLISKRFEATKFWLPCNQSGLGHEWLTDQHRHAIPTIKQALEVWNGNRMVDRANALLDSIAAYSGKLPENDQGDSGQKQRYGSDYMRVDCEFQQLKSLFCRAEANEKEMYRLAALTLFASRVIFAPNLCAICTLAGESVLTSFRERDHVRPKIGCSDVWAWLEQFGIT